MSWRWGWLGLCLFCCSLGWNLGGCAVRGDGIGSAAARDEVATESDETPQRKRARIRLELAVGYFEQGKTTIALDEVKQALQADPTFFDAYNLRGLIYMRLNEPALARESFQRALVLRPQDANVMHNLGWLQCQQADYDAANQWFEKALANPGYGERAKTWMTQGLCHARAGRLAQAEQSLTKSYEYDAANPITGFNLAKLLFDRGETARAQFYIRRLNNSEWANAESLWLGARIERKLGHMDVAQQLGQQLDKRFSDSPQAALWRRRAWDE